MLFRNLFKSKLHIFFVAVIVIALLNVSIKSLIFNSDKEIVYDFSAPRAICSKEATSCIYIGEFELANTGIETLESVSIDFGEMPEGISGSLKVLNLNAGNPREFDPKISNINFKKGGVIEINNFAPGTYIELSHSGWIPAQQKELLVNFSPKVNAKAAILQGDPRGTELVRLLGVFF